MTNLNFVIKKDGLNDSQINVIRSYKTFLIDEPSYVEEYQQGFKFYIDENIDVNNMIAFFKGIGIIPLDSTFFNEEWY